MPTYSISTIGYAMYGGATAFLRCDRCEREIHQFEPPGPGCGNLYGMTSEGVITLVPAIADLVHKHENACK